MEEQESAKIHQDWRRDHEVSHRAIVKSSLDYVTESDVCGRVESSLGCRRAVNDSVSKLLTLAAAM